MDDPSERFYEEVGVGARFFYHRMNWLNFLQGLGHPIEAYVIKKDGKYIANFFVDYFKRKFTRYGYVPGGIHFSTDIEQREESQIYLAFSEFLKTRAKENGVWSIRSDYFGGLDLDNLGFDISLSVGLPKYSWEIDLTQDLESIKSGMSKSTRHNVNKGEKSEIVIKKADSTPQVAEFYSLMSETTSRKGFLNFNLEYFKTQFDMVKGELCDLYIAYFQEKPIAAAWINYGSDTVFYTHGASTSNPQLAKLRSPYILQWELMKDMKERGFKRYNMWGVLPDYLDNSSISLKGVSDFKKSLGGDYYNSRGVFDIYSGFIPRILTRVYDWWIYRGDRY